MSLLNLKHSPSCVKTNAIEEIVLTCELRYMGLWPFVEVCIRNKIPVSSWPSSLPFWVLAQVYAGINIQKVELTRFVISKVRLVANDEIQSMLVEISAIYDGR